MISAITLLIAIAIAFYVGDKVGYRDGEIQWKNKPTAEYIEQEEKRIGTQVLEELLTNGDTKHLATQMVRDYAKGRTLPFTSGRGFRKGENGKLETYQVVPPILDSTPEYTEQYPNDSLIHSIVSGERFAPVEKFDQSFDFKYWRSPDGKQILSDEEYQARRVAEGLKPIGYGYSQHQILEDLKDYRAVRVAWYDREIKSAREAAESSKNSERKTFFYAKTSRLYDEKKEFEVKSDLAIAEKQNELHAAEKKRLEDMGIRARKND